MTYMPSTVWPLVGREAELTRLTAALDRGVPSLVIAGPAGVGKTRLADELLTCAASRGRHVLRAVVAPWPATTPFQALAAILPEPPDETVSRVAFLQRARRAILDCAEGQPVVLGIDDAHLLDDASTALAHYLVATGAVTVVMTLRSGQAAPPAVSALWTGFRAERVDLEPLRRGAVDELLVAILGGELESATGERLWQLSLGNPLVLRELLMSALETGSLEQIEGAWRLHKQIVASRRLQEILPARFGQLAMGVRAVLEVLAVGEPLGVSLLESLVELASLEAAERAGLVVERVEGHRVSAALAHPLYGEVLRATIPPAGLRAIRRALADRLEQTGVQRRDDLLRLVVWRSEAGERLEPDLLLGAARRASASYDFAMAGRLALKAVGLGGGLRARLAAAGALHALGRPREADELLADLDASAVTDNERAQLALNRATILLYGFGQAAAAASVLQAAEAEVGNPDWRAELAALHAEAALHNRDPRAALDEALGVVQQPGVGEQAVLRGLVVVVPALAIQGRGDAAIAAAEYARDIARRFEVEAPHTTVDIIELTVGIAYALAGRIQDYEALVQRRYQEALETHSGSSRVMWALARGACALYRGYVRTAVRQLEEAASLLRAHPTILGPYGLVWCLGELATAQALAGEPDRAASTLAAADNVLPHDVFSPQRALGRAWLAATRGDLMEARSTALQTASQARALGALGFELLALHDVARIGLGPDITMRLEELTDCVDGRFAPTCALHSCGLAKHDGDLLSEAARAFEAMGTLLLAAEAWAQAAPAYRRLGRSGRALRAVGNAKQLLVACENARTPVLRQLAEPVALTAREREVVALVCEGLTNRQTAERLGVSERTVESHRRSAYQKLQVNNVGALRALFEPPMVSSIPIGPMTPPTTSAPRSSRPRLL